jgi:hypothetical protein
MKSIVISSSWTFFVLVLPLWLTRASGVLPFRELILTWLLFYALTIPPDIRDSESDPSSMRTLPQMAGSFASGLHGMLLITLFGIGYFLINGKGIMLIFSMFGLLVFGNYLCRRKNWLVTISDASLIILGIIFLLN